MQLGILYFLTQCTIFYYLFDIAFTTPMIGENIRRAEPNEFPNVVAIKKVNNATTKPEDTRICTGALISQFHVLTAAHCMYPLLNQIEIIVGSVDIRAGTKHFPFWWVDYNEWAVCKNKRVKYDVNDISIIKMTVAASSNIVPAAISDGPNKNVYGLAVKAAGWGVINDGTNPQYLKTVVLRILSNSACEDKIERTLHQKIPIHHRFLCSVGERFALLQYGDSGCPIFLNGVIVAVQKATAPFPEVTFHPEKVNIHTGIAYYRNFILDILNNDFDWR